MHKEKRRFSPCPSYNLESTKIFVIEIRKRLPRCVFQDLGNGDDSLGGGGLLCLLSGGQLDLGGDSVEVTTALAG